MSLSDTDCFGPFPLRYNSLAMTVPARARKIRHQAFLRCACLFGRQAAPKKKKKKKNPAPLRLCCENSTFPFSPD
jgi:hypothetical protein